MVKDLHPHLDIKLTQQDIYQSKDVQKAQGYRLLAPEPGVYSTLTVINKSIHKHKRKVLSQGLSDQSVRAFEPTLLKHIEIFVANLLRTPNNIEGDSGWSSPIDMTDRCKFLAFDIMGEFGFGQSFKLQLQAENHFLIEAAKAVSFKASVYSLYPALARLKLEKLLNRRLISMREKYLRLMSDLVKRRLRVDVHAQHDLFSFIMNAKNLETG